MKAGTPAGEDDVGVERPMGDHQDVEPALKGLPSRRKCFTTATRRALHTAGATYFTALLCTTTILMNSLQTADFWEINGVCQGGHFGHTAAEKGITYEGFYKDLGHQLEKKSVLKKSDCRDRREGPGFCLVCESGEKLT